MEEKSHRVQIAIAIIGLIGVVTAAIISKTCNGPGNNGGAVPPPTPSSRLTPTPDGVRQAQELISEWIAALKSKDTDKLVRLADVPFYFDNELLVQREDIRKKWESFFSDQREQKDTDWQLRSLKVKSLADWKREGNDSTKDRVINSGLSLGNDVYIGECIFGKQGEARQEGAIVVVRRVDNGLVVAGYWG